MPLFGGVTIPGHPSPENIRRLDLLPLPQIRRMQRMGMAVDLPWLQDLSFRLDRRMEELRGEILDCVPVEALEKFVGLSGEEIGINPESSAQIAELLYEELGLGVGVRIKRTKGGTRLTTGKKTLEQLKKEHPVVPLILEYREASKLKGTYTDKMPKMAVWHEGRGPQGKWTCARCGRKHWEGHWRIHTSIMDTRTDTGRMSSKNPNQQNVPVRTELGAEVRKSFYAPKGYKLVGADYSGIELRLVSHCAREWNMIKIFRAGGDIHTDTAMRAFGISDPKQVNKQMHRAPCKNVNFGVCLAYGQRVLTSRGLVPIQDVSRHDMVWDGEEFVRHAGVIYKGVKEVIEWDGLLATPDHKVWLETGEKVTLAEAMAKGSRLAKTGSGANALRFNPVAHRGDPNRGEVARDRRPMHVVWEGEDHASGQYPRRQEQRMSLCSDSISGRPGKKPSTTIFRNLPALQQSSQSELSELWGARDQVQVPIDKGICGLRDETPTTPRLQGSRHWEGEQRWTLRTGESWTGESTEESQQHTQECDGAIRAEEIHCDTVMGVLEGEPTGLQAEPWEDKGTGVTRGSSGGDSVSHTAPQCPKETKEEARRVSRFAPVYDILNAGPRRRFTAEGRLVSNCYGLGPEGLLDLMAVTYATANIPMPEWMDLAWCVGFMETWFGLYPDVRAYLEMQHERARRYGFVWTPMGRVRLVPEVRSVHERVVAAGLRQAGNMPIQGFAADIMRLGMAIVEGEWERLRADGVEVEALMTIHDEILTEVEEDWAEGLAVVQPELMKRALVDMETGREQCLVQIEAEGKWMERWEK